MAQQEEECCLTAPGQQEEGWPLGLQPLTVRGGGVSGSISFSTLLTASQSSSIASSSDLDTQSTGSFFHDGSITLGSLIGISSILELSRRSAKGRSRAESLSKRSSKSRGWCLSLCAKTENNVMNNNAPSLGHFLEVERRASSEYKTNQELLALEPSDYTDSEHNLLFINGRVAPPPQSSPWRGRPNRSFGYTNGYGVPVLCSSCMCGQSSN